MTVKNTTALRAGAGMVRSHPLKEFFRKKHISQYRLAEMTGSKQSSVNRLLNGIYRNPDLERELIAVARDYGWRGDVTKETRLCRICRDEEPRPGMQVCDTCLGHGPKGKEMKKPEGDATQETAVCRECGKTFEPYQNGSAVIKRLCKECLRVRRAMNAGKTRGKLLVAVDFTGHEGLYDALCSLAHDSFRTPAAQLLALVADAAGKERVS